MSNIKIHRTLLFIVIALFVQSCSEVSKATPTEKPYLSGIPVKPGYQVTLPKDHGPHRQQGIEWWYLTSNLESETGEKFGVQWTLFRALAKGDITSSWWDNQVYFAHFALQDDSSHHSFERFARVGQAGIKAAPFNAFIDDWQLSSIKNDFLPLQLTAKQDDFSVNLTLENSPIVLHGDKGYSQKTLSGHASYYYSYPFLDVSGELIYRGKRHQVSGKAWYDREWSASLLDSSQLGWDWFSIQYQQAQLGGLMLFCIRGVDQTYQNCSGSKISASGNVEHIEHHQIDLKVTQYVSLDGREHPSQWKLIIDQELPLIIDTINKDSRNQLTIPYWEGRISVSGKANGRGYAEMTGY